MVSPKKSKNKKELAAATMTAPTASKVTKSRSPASLNSILDRVALLKALDERGITLKASQIEGFYQALHRQHYPSLVKFVENYYRNEARETLGSDSQDHAPIRNKVTNKKNKNRIQLNRQFLAFLKDPNNGFVTVSSKVDDARTSRDGTTTKLAIRLHDDHIVESVLMRYITKDGRRASLCVSSQVGCAMGCTFCATATMGIRGNLSAAEILEQLIHANRILAKDVDMEERPILENSTKTENQNLELVRNVVFMGKLVSAAFWSVH
jgi:hypothetical protein